ncbi:MAG: excinuclease ABC subunit UvrA [Proteobacteria bacterium]|nr:excinuclease ABC subunit UvrA [Pseudomonadota bacterium]
MHVIGARQHNLRNIDVAFPLGAITAVTGVSGSGKSSLAFDTLYAEGQRRYVESFSPFARQFMDRMDRPAVERIEGVLPAVAVDQKNAIKSSRSTVGTVTELADFFKLLWAHAAVLHCSGCGEPVRSDEAPQLAARLLAEHAGKRAALTFALPPCRTIKATAVALSWLRSEGFHRLWIGDAALEQDAASEPRLARQLKGEAIEVVTDRLRLDEAQRTRLAEGLRDALDRGRGRASVRLLDAAGGGAALRFSRGRHCAACDLSYPEPLPNHFSYNSPLGACPDCNGFGAIVGLDLELAIPDPRLSLAAGAIRPWSTASTTRERRELRRACARQAIPLDQPWEALPAQQRAYVIEGDRSQRWAGLRGWFRWLERRTYKMHVRVLLSRYRAYHPCPSCDRTRLRPYARLFRLGARTLPEVYALSLEQAARFCDQVALSPEQQALAAPVLREIRARLRYLCEVGVGYLTLDRQSRTLSGGEVQRVNLTTAIGSALVNTLYVLDEPSVGLHARDNARLLAILERLRANRNTIVIVEHDPAIIRSADHVIDLGPGPGAAGGQVVFAGPPGALAAARAVSATARHLYPAYSARDAPAAQRPPPRRQLDPAQLQASPALVVRDAREHNLAGLDVRLPLNALTVVSGVSGSGKSTLVETVLYRGLLRQRGRPTELPGRCAAIEGGAALNDVVLIDQGPVGTTPRSNPATYVKAYDAIRQRFAALPAARARGLSAASFSFNVAGGRCPACEGNGFERIEMQFLADCFVQCEKCGGRRFQEEVLAVTLDGRSIHEVLALTVDEAVLCFAETPAVAARLSALSTVGLGYLGLGQPLNTLSGGESQRLKLAAHLALHRSQNTLFLLDEPTTGLHVSDVARLIDNLHALVALGNTVVVIEHHLDVIAAADWVIDLGPEGGAAGGRLVAAGSPADLAATPGSHTGRYLAAEARLAAPAALRSPPRDRSQPGESQPGESQPGESQPGESQPAPQQPLAPEDIVLRGARVHNLANLDLRLPRDALVVITGPSGSGKSSLAFDVLFAEGQRRFVDCLSPYARQYVAQLGRPNLDELLGVPPTVAISQRTARGGPQSTVATVTEIYHYLRLLWARIGVQHCHRCGARVSGLQAADLEDQLVAAHAGSAVLLLAPMIRGRKGLHEEVLQRAVALGQERIRVDGVVVALEPRPRLARFRAHDLDYVLGEFEVGARASSALREAIGQALALSGGTVAVLPRTAEESEVTREPSPRTYSLERSCGQCGLGYEAPDPRLFSFSGGVGACPHCHGTGSAPEQPARGTKAARGRSRPADRAAGGRAEARCRACAGTRLQPAALAVRLGERSIAEATASTAGELRAFLAGLALSPRERTIATAALRELDARCAFLLEVGLDYLTLDRGAPTLSGGEAQRVRLAAQLSAELRGVLYVLDEPTIGLHPIDTARLLKTLRQLVVRGNSVVVVEHDEETIRRADHLIELGPGGGRAGGRLMAAGPGAAVLAKSDSLTARSLRLGGRARAVYEGRAVTPQTPRLELSGVRHHNLQGVDVTVPLGRLTVVTGVSGSGKSSLVRDVLATGLRRVHAGGPPLSGALEGAALVHMVREIDQSPIGRTPASTPATYVGLHDEIRRLFAGLPEARARGYRPGHFSFNVRGGRCERCRGQGQVRHEMSFLPDVSVGCEDCGGRRYSSETLQVRYRGLSIAEVLALTAAQAVEVFSALPRLRRGLALLCDVGLDYLPLGQPSHSLSGGEAQRIKLVEELQKEGSRQAIYLLDEPSTGLHLEDLRKLLLVLQRLVARGDSVVVIEHNLDVIASADWIIDLGPGGGAAGGTVLYQGPRDGLLDHPDAPTAAYLRAHLGEATSAGGPQC